MSNLFENRFKIMQKEAAAHAYTRIIAVICVVAIEYIAIIFTLQLSWFLYSFFILKEGFSFFTVGATSLLIGALFLGAQFLRGEYKFQALVREEAIFTKVLSGWNIALIAYVAFGFTMKVSDQFSRGHLLLSYFLGLGVLSFAHYYVTNAVKRALKLGIIAPERIILIGRRTDIRKFATRFQPWNHGVKIVETFNLTLNLPQESSESYLKRVRFELQAIIAQVRPLSIHDIYLVIPWGEKELIELAFDECLVLPASIHLAPETILERFRDLDVTRLGDMTTLSLSRPPLSTAEISLKRAFDLCVGTLIFITLLPLFLLIGVIIACESRGAVLFKQKRRGFNQEVFEIYKFRSMYVVEEGENIRAAKPNDPRITRIGRFIRRWNIDELPQILNVLRGEMSLVGPRPHALVHEAEFEQKVSFYARRYNIKPGMTGWAQVHGFRGGITSRNTMDKRVEYDLWYMDHWRLSLDVLIMVRTFSRRAFDNAY
jgi:Undecaprenyl-phosphate glucose phosphotransferase